MNTNDRVRIIRKELKLTMEAFGEKLGVTKATISRIESGMNALTDQMTRSICREFHVSEEWLLHGTGEMFQEKAEDYLTARCKERGFTETQEKMLRLIVEMFLMMTPEQRDYMTSELQKIIGKDAPAVVLDPVKAAEEDYIKRASASATESGSSASSTTSEKEESA